MKFVKIDPPGTFCTQEALRDALGDRRGQTFLDVGCGGGHLSKLLCDAGLTGVGVDFYEPAIEIAREALAPYIAEGKYRLQLATFTISRRTLPRWIWPSATWSWSTSRTTRDFCRRSRGSSNLEAP